MKNNEKGFSPVEIVLVLVLVALVGVVGFVVYMNHTKPTNSAASSSQAKVSSNETKPNTTPPTETTPFVNVIEGDSSIIQVAPNKIAETTDQAAILTALHTTCSGSNTYVTVNHVVFDSKPNFIQERNYAEINATACSPLAKTLNDLGGSGSANYLHKNSSSV